MPLTQADLEGRRLRYFLAVIRAGSIRAAAETLNVAASAVSRGITEMEQRLGLPLLERRPRGVVATEAGLAIAAHARQQMDDAERLIEYLRQLHGLRHGGLRIQCGEGFIADLLDHALAPFLAAHPGTRVQTLLGSTPEIVDAVAESRADLGIAYDPPPHPALRSAAAACQPLCAVMAPGHALAGQGRLPLAALAGQALAMMPRTHGLRALTTRAEAEQGLQLVPALESNSIELLRRFAATGAGIALLPAFAVTTELAAGRLAAVMLADPILAEARVALLVRARQRPDPLRDALIAACVRGMEAFAPA